jgi:hypothetical protein
MWTPAVLCIAMMYPMAGWFMDQTVVNVAEPQVNEPSNVAESQ